VLQAALTAIMAHLRAPVIHSIKPEFHCTPLPISSGATIHYLHSSVAFKSGNDAMDQPCINRRSLFSATAATTVAAFAQSAPAQASVTLTIKGKPQLQLYTLKSGYSITVPSDMTLAYVSGGDTLCCRLLLFVH